MNILKKDFLNCSILEISFTGPATATISVVWGGSGTEHLPKNQKDHDKMVIEETEKRVGVDKIYDDPPRGGGLFWSSQNNNAKTNDREGYTYIGKYGNELQNSRFFIIRHGYGQHNFAKTIGLSKDSRMKDASLTIYGEKEAKEAGTKLKQYLGQNGIDDIKAFFVSDLKRTHETCEVIMNQLGVPIETEMYVLPCLHEVYQGGKNCDSYFFNQPRWTAYENQTSGKPKITTNKRVNWKLYIDRTQPNCTQTNVFYQAYLECEGPPSPETIYEVCKRIYEAKELFKERKRTPREIDSSVDVELLEAWNFLKTNHDHDQCDKTKTPLLNCLSDEQYADYRRMDQKLKTLYEKMPCTKARDRIYDTTTEFKPRWGGRSRRIKRKQNRRKTRSKI